MGDLWKKLDKNGAGKITITEFERMFEEEDMRAFFGAIEMNLGCCLEITYFIVWGDLGNHIRTVIELGKIAFCS